MWPAWTPATKCTGRRAGYKVRGDGGAHTHAGADAYGLSQRRFWSWRAYWRRFADAEPSGSSCPAGSGSHLPPGAKMTPGNFVNWSGFRFGVRSVTTPSTVEFSNGNRRAAPHNRRWLMFNNHAANGTNYTVSYERRARVYGGN